MAMQSYGFEVISTGKRLLDNNVSGYLDVEAKRNGELCFIDIKSTAHMHNRWEDYGWDVESLDQKDKIMLQAVHYKYLGLKVYGKDIPFFFFVHSNINEIESAIIEVILDETRLDEHDIMLKQIRPILDNEIRNGFTAFPSVKLCDECPMKDTCQYCTEVPPIQKVYY